MAKRISASKLRGDIYRILDRVIETGAPVEIIRSGEVLTIARAIREEGGSKLDHLQAHPEAVTGDPADLVDLDWSGEWNP